MAKRIPYGVSDFERIRLNDYYYVDKTQYIPLVEDTSDYLFLIRPRRFGKSLFVSMLAAYYDQAKADKFDELFGDLWIAKHPTPGKNAYQVIKFDFSRAAGNADTLEESFNDYLCKALDEFIKTYSAYYDADTVASILSCNKAASKLNAIGEQAKRKGYPLYLIVDEYDNFTNVVLTQHGKEALASPNLLPLGHSSELDGSRLNATFHALTHANGFYREYFKIFKAIFTRVFLIGVSPITLDDLTSGYNIDWNISNDYRFNAMLGFSEEDVREMFHYFQDNGKLEGDIEAMIQEMKPWYDGYCFAEEMYGKESCYNCDMVLYYLRHRVQFGCSPKDMVDKNVKTDYKKLKMLADLDRGNSLENRMSVIEEIAAKGYLDLRLRTSFPAMDIMDDDNFRSLIYYYGMLSIGGSSFGELHMVIPNLTVQYQYWSFMHAFFQQSVEVRSSELRPDFRAMAVEGDWRPLIERIAKAYRDNSSIRDSILGEHNLQGFFKAYFSLVDYFIVKPEVELNYGYSDFLMLADTKRYPELPHSYIMELKYCKPTATDSEVEALREQADEQLHKYAADQSVQRLVEGTTLHLLRVIFRGAEMVECEQL